jgi:hypothetical protein
MERSWSLAVATSGNPSQILNPEKQRQQAKLLLPKDLLLQVFHGASRTRTGDLLGAI